MTYQTTVNRISGLGVPGDVFNNGPSRAEPFTLRSALASYNKIGYTAYTVVSQGVAKAGNTATTGVFAGVLINSKVYASYGTSAGGPLAPTLTLANETIGELMTMGSFIGFLSNGSTANIGDLVVFDNVTGALKSIAPGVATPAGFTNAIGIVDYFTAPTQPGMAVITLTHNPAGLYTPPAELAEAKQTPEFDVKNLAALVADELKKQTPVVEDSKGKKEAK